LKLDFKFSDLWAEWCFNLSKYATVERLFSTFGSTSGHAVQRCFINQERKDCVINKYKSLLSIIVYSQLSTTVWLNVWHLKMYSNFKYTYFITFYSIFLFIYLFIFFISYVFLNVRSTCIVTLQMLCCINWNFFAYLMLSMC
jgi:hypothetical protein